MMRWLVTLMVVLSVLGAVPNGAATQGDGTPGPSVPQETEPTVSPPEEPTVAPTHVPVEPTDEPVEPTVAPTEEPTIVPTEEPGVPTETPPEPTETPDEPTVTSTEEPDASPEAARSVQALLATGSMVISAVDAVNSAPVTSVCYVLYENLNGARGPDVGNGCDFHDGQDNGQTTIGGLEPGPYILAVTFVPDSGGYVVGGERIIIIEGDQPVAVTFPIERGGRGIRVFNVNENGAPLIGACFNVNEDLGNGQFGRFLASNCDGPSPGQGDGQVIISGLPVGGDYILQQYQTATGYVAADHRPFTLPSGSGLLDITVQNFPAESPGNLIINKVNENSQPLPGACFNVWEDVGGGQIGNFVDQQCDFEDGQLVFTGLDPDTYVLTESHAPDGYINGFQTTVTIVSDRATTLTVPNAPGGSNITIRKVDAGTGQLLTGACFSVYRDTGSGQPTSNTFLEGRCDDSEGIDNGITPFTGLAAGNYILEEFQAPDGYLASEQLILFTVDGTTDPTIDVENTPIDAPGNLIIDKVDVNGNPLLDACFVAFVDTGGGQAGEYVNGTCDWYDGNSDGTMVIASLEPGTYVVRETLAPDGYRLGGESLVTIPATGSGATLLTVTNVLGGATVTFNAVDSAGGPISGVCFDIYLNDGSGLATPGSYFTSGCTQPNVTFTGFPAGDYILIVYEVPGDYGIPRSTLFSVADGATELSFNVTLSPLSAADLLIRALIEILTRILASLGG